MLCTKTAGKKTNEREKNMRVGHDSADSKSRGKCVCVCVFDEEAMRML